MKKAAAVDVTAAAFVLNEMAGMLKLFFADVQFQQVEIHEASV